MIDLYQQEYDFAMPPDVIYAKLAKAIVNTPKLHILTGNEASRELHARTHEDQEYQYYLDFRVMYIVGMSRVTVTAKADQLSRDLVKSSVKQFLRIIGESPPT